MSADIFRHGEPQSTNDAPFPESRHVCDAWENMSRIGLRKYSFAIPPQMGHGQLRQISTYKHIIVSDFQMCFENSMEVTGTGDASNIDLCFCLEEGLEWEASSENRYMRIDRGETFISNNRHGVERACYYGRRNYNFIGIKFPAERLREVFSGVSAMNGVSIEKVISPFAKYAITPSLRVILKQLLHCPYRNGIQEMYAEAKLLELLSVYFGEFVLQTDNNPFVPISTDLSRADRKSIAGAKEILDKNITYPPSCSALARMVYLSESKLMRGFKALWGMSVHAYVIDKRLEKARFLFENGEKRVSTVAAVIGYGNMSHFSAAFRKKYGINPREYVKSVNE